MLEKIKELTKKDRDLRFQLSQIENEIKEIKKKTYEEDLKKAMSILDKIFRDIGLSSDSIETDCYHCEEPLRIYIEDILDKIEHCFEKMLKRA